MYMYINNNNLYININERIIFFGIVYKVSLLFFFVIRLAFKKESLNFFVLFLFRQKKIYIYF